MPIRSTKHIPSRSFRAEQVDLSDKERSVVEELYGHVTSPTLNQPAITAITAIFAQCPMGPGDDIDNVYKLLYGVERLITQWEKETARIDAWQQHLQKLNAAKASPGAEAVDEFDLQNEIDTCSRELNKRIMNAQHQRSVLYEAFFVHLHERFADNPNEIDQILKKLQENRPRKEDPIHTNLSNRMLYYVEHKDKNVAFSNPWYLIAVGAFVSATGLAFMITTLVTGMFAPYLIPFIVLLVSGLGIAWMGGSKGSQRAWVHRNIEGMEAALYREAHLKDKVAYQKPHKSELSYFTWETTPIILLSVAFMALIIADFYLGGPLSALGLAFEISLIQRYTTFPLVEILDMALIGVMGFFGLKIIERITQAFDNKTLQRAHGTLRDSYSAIFRAFSLCSLIATPFVTPMIPMVMLPIAGLFFCFCLWQRVFKGQEKWVIDTPANPGFMGVGAAPAGTMTIDYNSGLFYSGMVVAVCVVTAFALISNPFTFGLSILLLATVAGIAKTQIMTHVDVQDKENIQRHVGTELKELNHAGGPQASSVLRLIDEKNLELQSQATNSPVRMSQNNMTSTPTSQSPGLKKT